MAINKVVYGNDTLIDITDTTAESTDVAQGEVFYNNAGVRTVGTGNYMDKVSNPTANDILVTDANGQAIDSGVSISTMATQTFVGNITGDLANLTTDDKSNIVNAINEVYEKSGEPFRVKNWATNTLNVSIPTCTTDIANTQIGKLVFSIDDVEGADYQIVGMIAYEVFDSVSGGQRINCWPVCQFTGNGQKELGVRFMCGGTTAKTARRINAWVLLKHR